MKQLNKSFLLAALLVVANAQTAGAVVPLIDSCDTSNPSMGHTQVWSSGLMGGGVNDCTDLFVQVKDMGCGQPGGCDGYMHRNFATQSINLCPGGNVQDPTCRTQGTLVASFPIVPKGCRQVVSTGINVDRTFDSAYYPDNSGLFSVGMAGDFNPGQQLNVTDQVPVYSDSLAINVVSNIYIAGRRMNCDVPTGQPGAGDRYRVAGFHFESVAPSPADPQATIAVRNSDLLVIPQIGDSDLYPRARIDWNVQNGNGGLATLDLPVSYTCQFMGDHDNNSATPDVPMSITIKSEAHTGSDVNNAYINTITGLPLTSAELAAEAPYNHKFYTSYQIVKVDYPVVGGAQCVYDGTNTNVGEPVWIWLNTTQTF